MDVLFVGQDQELQERAADALEDRGMRIVTVDTVSDAQTLLSERTGLRFVAITDNVDGSPFDLYNYLLEYYPDVPAVIFASSLSKDEIARRPEKVVEYSDDRLDIALENLGDLIETAVEFQTETLYPVPEDEKDRLTTLDELNLDQLEDAPFYHRLTRLGANFFDVPMCYVGVIDRDQERFLACHGTEFDAIDRGETICQFAIIRDDVMVVDNVQEDPRFADVDALQELDLAWYASASITVDGHRIGTFCIADTEQHGFTEDDKEHLQLFADEFAEQLEHHAES